MMIGDLALRNRRFVPPYGPAHGMMQGLQLLQRTSPLKVDGELLRTHGIAPGNEYKVVGALEFLGLIDEEGKPTEKSRLLKTKGSTYSASLREIIYTAYGFLFDALGREPFTPEQAYNYFVTESGLGAEMAAKATRFFVGLCRLAEIALAARQPRSRKPTPTERPRARKLSRPLPAHSQAQATSPDPEVWNKVPFVLALTPEMARMDLEELTAFLKRMRLALHRVSEAEKPGG